MRLSRLEKSFCAHLIVKRFLGLVLPAVSKSKAELVAAGVLPVDRLVDVVAPVATILSKIGKQQFCQTYGLKCIQKRESERLEAAVEYIAAMAISRGWYQSAGRPDQTKAGREIIKDFINGKLIHCEMPPNSELSHVESIPLDQEEAR